MLTFIVILGMHTWGN